MILTQNNLDADSLVESNLGLVHFVARKCLPVGTDVENTEEFSDGLLGLLEAARTYDPKMAKFSTWAVRIIRRHIWKGILERAKNGMNYLSQDVKLSRKDIDLNTVIVSNGGSHDLEDVLYEAPGESEEIRMGREMLLMHFLKGFMWAEIASEFGIQEHQVYRIVKNTKEYLKGKIQ